MKDLSGQRFGRLTAIRPVGKRKNSVVWRCECDCGNTKDVASYLLTAGKTKSCGCLRSDAAARQGRSHDLKGKRFGMLTAKERVGTRYRYALWRCECDCGRVCEVSSRDLTGGRITDCGCQGERRATSVRGGRRFGKLVAVDKADDARGGSALWRCLCDCGNVAYVSADDLLSHAVTDCGNGDAHPA